MKKYAFLLSLFICFQASAEMKVSEVPPEYANHPHGADTLSKEFNENIISAKQKYNGKTLVIIATAISVDENTDGKPVVTVKGGTITDRVNLIFKKVDDNIIKIKQGSYLEALCESPEKSGGYLQLSNCEMIVPN